MNITLSLPEEDFGLNYTIYADGVAVGEVDMYYIEDIRDYGVSIKLDNGKKTHWAGSPSLMEKWLKENL